MDIGVFQQVRDQTGPQRRIHAGRKPALFAQGEAHAPPGVNLGHIFGRTPDQRIEIDLLRFGELAVLDLRQQQQRTVEPHQIIERPLHLHNLAQLLLAQRRAVAYEHLQPVAANRQRRLHFVRRIADELLLAVEQHFGPLGIADRRLVQPPEFGDLRIVGQRSVLSAYPVAVEPPQQGIQGPQGAVEHQYVDQQNGQQQEKIQIDDPPENRLLQIVLLDGRRHHGKLLIASLPVAEDHPQHARRLLLVLLRNENLLVAVNHMGPCGGVFSRDVVQEIAVVAARKRRRKLTARKIAFHKHLGIVFERIVDFVVDLVDHREIEKHRPRRQQQRERPRHMEQDAVNEFHGVTSL